ncbi:MAG: polysaccharide deacetylase family protein, partial [Bacteroidota bacterium]|nr:polysaccharide deacetylase family protein [Bacteroidota bacterium]
MKPTYLLLILAVFGFSSCFQHSPAQNGKPTAKNKSEVYQSKNPVATAAEILEKRQVPVLCYHHIREPKPGQSLTLESYAVTPEEFASQMKALKDSGYQTILPDDLYSYLVYGKKLPAKPVMITFDDTDEEQFTIGSKEMKKYGFKGVFFVMTVSIDKPRYMTRAQLKELSDEGNAVESHTW